MLKAGELCFDDVFAAASNIGLLTAADSGCDAARLESAALFPRIPQGQTLRSTTMAIERLVVVLAIGATIALAASCGGGDGSGAAAPVAKFAYVANFGSDNVSAYTINTNTGALAAIAGSPFAAGANPVSVSVDPFGRFAYVANEGTNNVSAYTINTSTGALAAIAG